MAAKPALRCRRTQSEILSRRGMIMRCIRGWIYLTAPLLAACTAAPIALPSGLATRAQAVSITGMGYGERGNFAIGNSSGTFLRNALTEEEGQFLSPPHVLRSYGGSRFRVSGPDFEGLIEGQCVYDEAHVTEGPATTTVSPFLYRCEFLRNGDRIDAALVLHAAPRKLGPFATETRAGELNIGGRKIVIQPIHLSPKLRLPASEPLGYRFISNGLDVAAIDINGVRKTVYVGAVDREAVMIASVALSLLWYH